MIRLANRLLAAAPPPAPGGGEIVLVGYKTAIQVGTTSSWSTSLTDLIGGIDTAPSAGDLVVASYAIASRDPLDPTIDTSGYVTRASAVGDATSMAHLKLATKVMGGTPDTTLSLASTVSTANGACVSVYVYRGVDPVTPMDVAPATRGQAGSLRPNPEPITPVSPGSVVFAVGSSGSQVTSRVYTSADLSNFSTAFRSDTRNCNIGAGDSEWVSGEFNPAVWGLFVGSDDIDSAYAAITIALRPA